MVRHKVDDDVEDVGVNVSHWMGMFWVEMLYVWLRDL
jgi:hypothetical protein